MDKEEILAKSRAENKNKDVYESEVAKLANSAAVLVMLVIAGVFFLAQLYVGGGLNFGVWAIIFAADMTMHWVKYAKLKRKGELLAAILNTAMVAALAGCHLYNLFISGR